MSDTISKFKYLIYQKSTPMILLFLILIIATSILRVSEAPSEGNIIFHIQSWSSSGMLPSQRGQTLV